MFTIDLKNRIAQNHWRNYFLATVAIGTNIVAVSALIIPTRGNLPVADFKFPQRIKLNSGIIIASELTDIAKSSPDSSELVEANQKYQYEGTSNIGLTMDYIVGTRGDVGSYLQNYTEIPPKVIKTKSIKQLEGIGYHTVFTDNNRAYLSSCISPRSPSNVTQKQFSQYRYQNDLKTKVAWQWLQGKASIRDRRCLWVLLSTPTKGNTQADYQALETAWKDIYQWWLPNFPNLTSDRDNNLTIK